MTLNNKLLTDLWQMYCKSADCYREKWEKVYEFAMTAPAPPEGISRVMFETFVLGYLVCKEEMGKNG